MVYDSSSDGNDQLLRSNTEQPKQNGSDSGSTEILNSFFGTAKKADWREYFEDAELDKAYQIVEVERRDETDASSSDGSNSNPSEDNFEEEEVYRKVYGFKNPEEIIEKRKIVEKQFIEKVN